MQEGDNETRNLILGWIAIMLGIVIVGLLIIASFVQMNPIITLKP
jgi:hypothetical protein